MIYLREKGGQCVGPFRNRRDAERFIKLMDLCGEDWTGTEVVEELEPDGGSAHAAEERSRAVKGIQRPQAEWIVSHTPGKKR
jgi:hypothetical protein